MKVAEAVRYVRPRCTFVHSCEDEFYVRIATHPDKVLLAKYRGFVKPSELDPAIANLTVVCIYPHENMQDIVIGCTERKRKER